MPQSIEKTRYLTIEEAAKIVPGNPHKNTLTRWMTRGLRGVRLQSWKLAGRRVTTVAALDAFFGATAEKEESTPSSPSHEAAERFLDSVGI